MCLYFRLIENKIVSGTAYWIQINLLYDFWKLKENTFDSHCFSSHFHIKMIIIILKKTKFFSYKTN